MSLKFQNWKNLFSKPWCRVYFRNIKIGRPTTLDFSNILKYTAKEYDVIIVGSGAGGGMATKVLSEAGLSVAVVRDNLFYPAKNKEIETIKTSIPFTKRRVGSTTRHFGDYDQAYGGWEIEGEPYGQIGDTDFKWFRSECWAAEQIIGEEYHLDSVQTTLKEKSIDGLGETGQFSR